MYLYTPLCSLHVYINDFARAAILFSNLLSLSVSYIHSFDAEIDEFDDKKKTTKADSTNSNNNNEYHCKSPVATVEANQIEKTKKNGKDRATAWSFGTNMHSRGAAVADVSSVGDFSNRNVTHERNERKNEIKTHKHAQRKSQGKQLTFEYTRNRKKGRKQ